MSFMYKVCIKCKEEKIRGGFSKRKSSKDGLASWCKLCNKSYLKEHYNKNKDIYSKSAAKYYQDNKEIIKDKVQKYKEENIEYYKNYMSNYQQDNKDILKIYKSKYYQENKEHFKILQKEYRECNREYYLNYLSKWRNNNTQYMVDYWSKNKDKRCIYNKRYRNKYPHTIAWRNILKSAIRRMYKVKNDSTLNLLGYTDLELKTHLESLFNNGMSWSNHGEWHIDHIYPLSKFDENTPMCIVNALDNLQPLWAKDNLSKSNKIIEQ